MRIGNDSFIEEGTTTNMAVSFNSTPVWLGHICNYSIQLVFTGAPSGTFSLEMSNDEGDPSLPPARQYQSVTHWTHITGSDQPIVAAGNHAYTVANAGYRWVRFVWTAAAGTGTLISAQFNVKGV